MSEFKHTVPATRSWGVLLIALELAVAVTPPALVGSNCRPNKSEQKDGMRTEEQENRRGRKRGRNDKGVTARRGRAMDDTVNCTDYHN